MIDYLMAWTEERVEAGVMFTELKIDLELHCGRPISFRIITSISTSRAANPWEVTVKGKFRLRRNRVSLND